MICVTEMIFAPGDRVEISHNSENMLNKVFVTKIEDIWDEKYFSAYIPIHSTQLIVLPRGFNYHLEVYTHTKGIVSCTARVIEYFKKDGLRYMSMEILSDIVKTQRRDFFRLDVALPLKFTKIDLHSDSDNDDSYVQMFNGIIRDIGGGGIRFIADVELLPNDLLQCVIVINKQYIISAGKILDKVKIENAKYKYQYRIKFTTISQYDQDKIVKYIFSVQRKILKKPPSDS